LVSLTLIESNQNGFSFGTIFKTGAEAERVLKPTVRTCWIIPAKGSQYFIPK